MVATGGLAELTDRTAEVTGRAVLTLYGLDIAYRYLRGAREWRAITTIKRASCEEAGDELPADTSAARDTQSPVARLSPPPGRGSVTSSTSGRGNGRSWPPTPVGPSDRLERAAIREHWGAPPRSPLSALNGGTLAVNSAFDDDDGDIGYLEVPSRRVTAAFHRPDGRGQGLALLLPPLFAIAYAKFACRSLLGASVPLEAVAGAD